MNQYLAEFKFTTVKGNEFTGRSGQVELESELPLQELDMAEVKQCCVDFVLSKKPKWNIFMLDVMSVKPNYESKKLKTKHQ